MNRRELLKQVALITGGTIIGAEFFLTGCKAKATPAKLTAAQLSLLDEIGETIIPTTDTPGAKAAKIGEFMKTIVSDCYTQKQQDAFMEGISSLEAACKKSNSKSFMDCTPKQRHDLLVSLEKEAKPFNEEVKKENDIKSLEFKKKNQLYNYEATPKHYYSMMKELTLWGYFTSKIGKTEALRNNPVPGRYDGNAPYVKGEKAWA